MTLDALQHRLGYVFLDLELLEQALTHASYANERRVPDNERLEFLGDAVLESVASALLVRRFPQAREGELSRLRSRLVNTGALATIARELELGPFLRLGAGEVESGGRDRPRILAGAVEAILGAVFLEGGYDDAAAVADPWLKRRIKALDDQRVDLEWKDPKSRLQERVQKERRLTPAYEIVHKRGPEHAPTYTVEVVVHTADGREVMGRAEGPSRKRAEKAAALVALEGLEG